MNRIFQIDELICPPGLAFAKIWVDSPISDPQAARQELQNIINRECSKTDFQEVAACTPGFWVGS